MSCHIALVLKAKQELKVGIALVRQDLTKLASSIALAVEVLKATVPRQA